MTPFDSPFKLWRAWLDAGRFAAEAQSVVAQRMVRLARGGPLAATEAQRMVAEKVSAFVAAQIAGSFALATGKSLPVALKRAAMPFKSRVRANRRRLTRASRVIRG